ncbi:Dyp-type peroxidase [Rugosimonospora africana]|uniref:Peroxidase n=1 Tax=Rugosimonospora africana TaxID=556532 RepID=A0A8J3QTM4_9ACTN|nr:Dyp-type peroxidase [Rugosimonospora africana]GIH16261.1 peroxidase [Rugosimonospora africana]
MTEPVRPVPQAVLAPLTSAAIFLVMTVREGGEPAVRELLSDLGGLQRSVGFRAAEGGLSCVVGIGATAWDRLFDAHRPAELHPFRELVGDRHTAVSTPGDLLFHLRASRLDLCFELASLITARLGEAATVVDEVHGFRYFDRRDLLGFVDGTENPTGPAATAAVTIGAEDPDHAGASYVIVQKYLHDVAAWNRLPVDAQEHVIGRTKLSDVELPDEVRPTNSHVSVNTIVDADGTEREILRDNMPFGSVGRGEFGTYFIGYAATPSVIERMLERMFLGEPRGNYDRILDFSTAVTGSLFFVPTADFLEDLPAPLPSSAESLSAETLSAQSSSAQSLSAPADTGPEPAESDGSLGIGDLKLTVPKPSVSKLGVPRPRAFGADSLTVTDKNGPTKT